MWSGVERGGHIDLSQAHRRGCRLCRVQGWQSRLKEVNASVLNSLPTPTYVHVPYVFSPYVLRRLHKVVRKKSTKCYDKGLLICNVTVAEKKSCWRKIENAVISVNDNTIELILQRNVFILRMVWRPYPFTVELTSDK